MFGLAVCSLPQSKRYIGIEKGEQNGSTTRGWKSLTEWVNSVNATKDFWHCGVVLWKEVLLADRGAAAGTSALSAEHVDLWWITLQFACVPCLTCVKGWGISSPAFTYFWLLSNTAEQQEVKTLQASHPTSAFKLPLHPSWTILHLQDNRGNPLISSQLPDVAPHPNTSYSGCKNFTVRLLSGRSKCLSTSTQVFLALCNTPDRSAPFVFICAVIWLVSNHSEVHADGSASILRSPSPSGNFYLFWKWLLHTAEV